MNTVTKASKARIESIRLERVVDIDADTSYLGEFTDNVSPEAFVRFGEFEGKQIKELTEEQIDDLPSKGREYRYFLPAMTGETTGNPESPRQDWQRMESLNNGEWCYIGIVAKAVIVSAQGVIQTLRSGGLWGTESDSDKKHIESIEQEELDGLRAELESFGFKKRAIDHAFKNIVRKYT